jgi:hypothetical protein
MIITVDEGGILCIILYCRSDMGDNDRGRGGVLCIILYCRSDMDDNYRGRGRCFMYYFIL